jgi:hypothetical protein
MIDNSDTTWLHLGLFANKERQLLLEISPKTVAVPIKNILTFFINFQPFD